MNNRQHKLRFAEPTLQMLMVLMLALSTGFGIARSVSAQAHGGMVIGAVTCDSSNYCWNEIGAQFTVTTEDGTYLGSCTVEGNPNDNSHVAACLVSFPFEITGTVVVTENVDTVTPGYAPEENPIYFQRIDNYAPSHDVVFRNLPVSGNIAAETSNIAIVTTENGMSVTDACFVLTTYGNIGCDDNGDGKITFQDVPLGTYTVHQTANLGPGRFVNDFPITVTGARDGDGWERFHATVTSTSDSSASTLSISAGARDIALITRDPDDGHLVTDGCYVLLEYGNEGCDENGDGQITYADVPLGVYTVHQTRTPSGYPTIAEFQITVNDLYQEAPVGYVVRQAVEQNAPGTRNVSIVFVDSRTHAKVESTICAALVGGSERACDDALIDGQIDFLDVPAGNYPIEFTGLPAGWQIPNGGVSGPTVTVDASPGAPSNQFVYVEVVVPDSAGPGSGSSSGTSGSTETSSSNSSASATLLMTFRGCPEGFDPATQDFFSNCTIPLDAPDASFIFWGAEGQGGMNIAWLERQYDGAYIYTAWPLTMNVELSGLAPVVRDAYQVIGADSTNGSTYSVHLVDGEVREVFVFYYFE